jgi:hypothetical protein
MMGGQKLSGSISAALGEVTSLQVIDISHNNLGGTIPSQLSSLSGLATLDLSYNTLTGPVPWVLVSWSSAGRLLVDVRGSSLVREVEYRNLLTLPDDITEQVGSVDVTSVNVSGWGLVGTIPSQLSSLSGLTTLDLSHNVLQGPIPFSLASLTALQVLRLNNNLIVGGTIPAGVPFVGFPQDGDCEMGGQCSACSYETCCFSPYGQEYDPTCTDSNENDIRRDTPMCRVCGFYDTGTCSRHSNSCANATRSERMCGANCNITTHTNTPGALGP